VKKLGCKNKQFVSNIEARHLIGIGPKLEGKQGPFFGINVRPCAC